MQPYYNYINKIQIKSILRNITAICFKPIAKKYPYSQKNLKSQFLASLSYTLYIFLNF